MRWTTQLLATQLRRHGGTERGPSALASGSVLRRAGRCAGGTSSTNWDLFRAASCSPDCSSSASLPFLLLVSAALGSDFSHAVAARSHLSPAAARDVTSLFAHKGGGVTSQSIIGLVLVALGGESLGRNLQSWYAKVFDCSVGGWRAQARRLWWLGGAFGFVALQYGSLVMFMYLPQPGRPSSPWPSFSGGGHFTVCSRAVSNGDVCSSVVRPRRPSLAVGLLFVAFGSSSITSTQRIYGPVGTITVLLEVLVGLGVAIHLGALLGSHIGRSGAPGQVATAS